MTIFSFLINAVIFFLLLNIGYIRNKRMNPSYPDKSISQAFIFPLALALVFTLLFDVFKGLFIYQILIFAVSAGILYWLFYMMGKNKK
ncbi:hypothetical protein [Syntrophomonas palmitatica]|uniref:hypothetical protein n=1 Tax=Syntrophomonas palmitatica TaxID=402877 RepID=UPI0006D216FF|nr:hypothetical protein [Syntrophomonas palmitatica]